MSVFLHVLMQLKKGWCVAGQGIIFCLCLVCIEGSRSIFQVERWRTSRGPFQQCSSFSFNMFLMFYLFTVILWLSSQFFGHMLFLYSMIRSVNSRRPEPDVLASYTFNQSKYLNFWITRSLVWDLNPRAQASHQIPSRAPWPLTYQGTQLVVVCFKIQWNANE